MGWTEPLHSHRRAHHTRYATSTQPANTPHTFHTSDHEGVINFHAVGVTLRGTAIGGGGGGGPGTDPTFNSVTIGGITPGITLTQAHWHR